MTAREFWKSFEQNIKLEKVQLESVWHEQASFTEKITALISRVIKDAKPSNNFIVQPEYYNIDLTEWEQKKLKTIQSLQESLMGICIASVEFLHRNGLVEETQLDYLEKLMVRQLRILH
mgnify:CR=1 FL=1